MTLFQTKLKRISTLTLTDVSLAVIKLTFKNSLIIHNPLTYEMVDKYTYRNFIAINLLVISMLCFFRSKDTALDL